MSALALAGRGVRPHAPGMFVVSEADAAAIRTVFDRGYELSAAVEESIRISGVSETGGTADGI